MKVFWIVLIYCCFSINMICKAERLLIDTTIYCNQQITNLLNQENLFAQDFYGVTKLLNEFLLLESLPSGLIIVNYPQSNKKLLLANTELLKINGEVIIYYENGRIRERVNIVNGKKEGIHLYFRKDGTLESRAEFKNGEIDGTYIEYYMNGYPSEKIYFKNGVFIGKRIIWHSNGVRQCELQESDYGYSNGFCVCWDINGSKIFEGDFYGERPIGEVKYFYKNGNIKKHGFALSHVQDSMPLNFYNVRVYERQTKDEGSFINDCSVYREWYEDGTPKVKIVLDTKNTSLIYVEYYYKNGNLKSKGEMVLKESLDDSISFPCWGKKGTWFFWSENGNLINKKNFPDSPSIGKR